MAGVPQAVGRERCRTFGRRNLYRSRCFADAGGQLMDHTVFNIQDPAQRPGQTRVQARTEHLHRFAKTFVDPAALQRYFVQACQ
ncbi:hypothetical protein D3C84_657880 [compost metagenome]